VGGGEEGWKGSINTGQRGGEGRGAMVSVPLSGSLLLLYFPPPDQDYSWPPS
jgi:hypothetical protein